MGETFHRLAVGVGCGVVTGAAGAPWTLSGLERSGTTVVEGVDDGTSLGVAAAGAAGTTQAGCVITGSDQSRKHLGPEGRLQLRPHTSHGVDADNPRQFLQSVDGTHDSCATFEQGFF